MPAGTQLPERRHSTWFPEILAGKCFWVLVFAIDVLSFHCYGGPDEMEAFIRRLKTFGRPLVCTEYMARPKSTFDGILPILKAERVGAISFGLVAGKMNTYYPWGSKPGSPEPKVWRHDILRRDGTPFSAEEVVLIRQLTRSAGKTGR